MVNIELTEEEAGLFKRFRQFQDEFELMERKGVFDYQAGHAWIHRNSAGDITKITIKAVVYPDKYERS